MPHRKNPPKSKPVSYNALNTFPSGYVDCSNGGFLRRKLRQEIQLICHTARSKHLRKTCYICCLTGNQVAALLVIHISTEDSALYTLLYIDKSFIAYVVVVYLNTIRNMAILISRKTQYVIPIGLLWDPIKLRINMIGLFQKDAASFIESD